MNLPKIAIIGLGYVGLPLARLLATRYAVVGYDKKSSRVDALKHGEDSTLEVETNLLQEVLTPTNPTLTQGQTGLFCTHNPDDLAQCNYFIVTTTTCPPTLSQ